MTLKVRKLWENDEMSLDGTRSRDFLKLCDNMWLIRVFVCLHSIMLSLLLAMRLEVVWYGKRLTKNRDHHNYGLLTLEVSD